MLGGYLSLPPGGMLSACGFREEKRKGGKEKKRKKMKKRNEERGKTLKGKLK
jgi:hypothetical protein